MQEEISQKSINFQPKFRPKPIFQSSVKNATTRVICVAAVGIEPLYSAFLWQSIVSAAETAIEMFGASVTPVMREYIKYIAIPFAAANLMSDLVSVDPLRDADEFTAPSDGQKNDTELSKRLLGLFIKILAVMTSFPAAASSDALPVANFTAHFVNGTGGEVIDYSVLSIVGALGVVYYSMFTFDRIQRHSNEFIDTLKNFAEFARNFAYNPGKYLEVYLQSISNSFYRGVSFAYILGQTLEVIFRLDKNSNLYRGLNITTGVTTFFVTMFSRLLSTRDRFLNPKFKELTDEDLDAAPIFRKEFISDVILSLIRGGAVGAIVSELIHLPLAYKYSLSSLIGFAPFAHSLYVRYQAGRNNNALNLKGERQKANAISITEKIDNTVQTEQEHADDNETRSLLEDDNFKGKSELIDPVTLAPKLFDEIAASYNSPAFNFAIDAVNFTARFTRFVAFFLFVQTINEIFLDNYFSPTAVIGLVFLWGAEVFKNDGDLYSEAMKTTCQSMAAKWQLASARRDGSWCSFFPNAASVVGTSLYDYSIEELKEAKSERSYSLGIQ